MGIVDIMIHIPAEPEENQPALEKKVLEQLRQRPGWNDQAHFWFDSFQWRGHGYDVTVFIRP